MNTKTKKGRIFELLAGSGSAVTALLAFTGASCCVLPVVLLNLGLSVALVSQLEALVRLKAYFLTAAAILIALGFLGAFWRGRKPRKLVLGLLLVSSGVWVLAYAFPYFEKDILQWLSQ